MTRFVVVPQWQGSGSARAMRLVDGAEAIRGDLPAASTTVVEVPLEAGDARGSGVHRLGSIEIVRDRLREVLASLAASHPQDVALTIGGDCGVELAAVEHAAAAHPDMALVWFDAHGDAESPESTPSHAFAGMTVRTLVGDGVDELVPPTLVDPGRVVLAGARDLSDDEDAFLADGGVALIDPIALESPDELVAAVRASGAGSVYVHVDLDVLDPGEFAGTTDAVPFGITATQLVAAVRALRAEWPLAGAGIAGFAPASPEAALDDLPTILRLVGALTAKQ